MQHRELNKWINDYTDELFRWAYFKTSSKELAEDLVQDVFMAAVEKIDSYEGKSNPKTWLFSILNNKIIDHYRKKSRRAVAYDPGVLQSMFDEHGEWDKKHAPRHWDEGHLLDNEDFLQVLKACMDLLPDQWRQCVMLKYFSHKKGAEICQDVDITPTNLWQIIHRAKIRLRECVENNWISEE